MAAGDEKLAYAASAALTVTLASLATDANLLAGRSSVAVVNSAALYSDYLLSGTIRTGTSPTTGKRIQIWTYSQLDDTPSYPDTIEGTDANKSLTSAGIKVAAFRLAKELTTDATSDRDYPFGQLSIAALFGGIIPEEFGVFVVHDTGVNLNSTGSNHFIKVQGIYRTIEQ